MFRWINGRDPRQYGLDFGLAVLRAERNDLGADPIRLGPKPGGNRHIIKPKCRTWLYQKSLTRSAPGDGTLIRSITSAMPLLFPAAG